MSCSTDRSAVWDSCWRDRQGDGCSSMVGTFGTRSFWPLVAPLSDEPDASAMPATSRRRHVGQGAVALTIGLFDDWIAAEVKIRTPRIAARPAAGFRGERIDLFGGGGDGQVWVGKGFRRRLDESRNRRSRFAGAIC